MSKKLKLSINEEIVKKAKRIAQIRGKSVSKIFEEFISSLKEKEAPITTPFREIINLLREGISIPEDINHKEFIRENRYREYEAKHKEG